MNKDASEYKLIDRNAETNAILEDINKYQALKQNKILFIWADTGIGKTSVIEKIQQNKNLNTKIAIVDTPPANDDDITNNGAYITYIANTLNNVVFNDRLSLKDYLRMGVSQRLDKQEVDNILDKTNSINNIVPNLICTLLRRYTNVGIADSDKILNSNDTDSILIKIEYIKFLLQKYPFVLDITNIQNIDFMTVRSLQKILTDNNNMYFIFEFTTINSDTTKLWKLVKTFERYADIEVAEITKLSSEYALKIVQPNNFSEIDAFQKFYTEIADGNIYKLRSAKNEISKGNTYNLQQDPILSQISKLSYGQKIILAIICLNNGVINRTTLLDIIEKTKDTYYILNDDIFALQDLIDIFPDVCKIKHATIIDSFNLSPENYAAVVAYKLLLQYYTLKVTTTEISNDIISYQYEIIKLHSIFDPIQILSEIKVLKKILVTCLSEENGTALLTSIFNSITDDVENNVKIHIINIAYEAGFYKTAFKLLNEIECSKNKYPLLYCMLLNRNDYHIECIELCVKHINKSINDRITMILKMIKMLSERSLNNNAYVSTFWDIYNTTRYKQYYEYGFLLRNAQIVFDYQASINYLNESISFFTEKKSYKDAACTELTLCVQLARLGKLDIAQKRILAVKDELFNSTFEKHIVMLNMVAIELLSGNTNNDIFLQLERCLVTAITSFDKIVILNNELCWHILNKSSEQEFIAVKKQLDLALNVEPDKRLHRRTYINYAKYYDNVLNNIEKSLYWEKVASQIILPNDKLGNAFLRPEAAVDTELQYLASKPYYISFITYWHFDLPMI